uniref:Small ribosomal subunit protein uS7c n=1 Tax=Prasinoderma coloniale TaxID=156133 RepID=A0A088CIB3_9VIRI|nr:ribosomal protein S7 [Prasinoderma coloniale]AID67568.1 ribosomal protein S7 [Prasinoderma coloniale]
MSRRKKKISKSIKPDAVYRSTVVSMLISRVLLDGKRSLAQRIVYSTLQIIETRTQEDPLQVLEKALRHVTPIVEVKSRRIGGSIYQIPQEVKRSRGTTLAVKWLLQGAQSRNAFSFSEKLAQEIIDASQSLGSAIKKKEEIHRMAEANKAFAHFKS